MRAQLKQSCVRQPGSSFQRITELVQIAVNRRRAHQTVPTHKLGSSAALVVLNNNLCETGNAVFSRQMYHLLFFSYSAMDDLYLDHRSQQFLLLSIADAV